MDINNKAEIFVQKIKHLIITTSGHTSDNASIEEFYQAFCTVLREEMMINRTAAIDTFQKEKRRMLFFISMEFLPGRLTGNNITNMSATELVKAVLTKMNRNFKDLMSCETDAGLGNGGLGRLSSCFLDSLATLQYPARGYGLRYQYGIFEQELWNGVQIERPDCWLLNTDPWEIRFDLYATNVHFRGKPIEACNIHGEEVYLLEDYEEVRALPYDLPIIGYSEKSDYSVLNLRLWSTKESPRNFQLQKYNAGFLGQAAENTTLTDVLYPNDNTDLGRRIRLKQEFLLVSASLEDIIRRHLHIFGDISSFADKTRLQLNDTHPALMIAELVRTLTKSYNFSWKEAWETCQTCCSYTNHTILSEALEVWSESQLKDLLPRQYRIIQKLNQDFCDTVRVRFPNDENRIRRVSIIENGQIKMAHLSIVGSHKVNGVAKLHSDILKNTLFKDFDEIFPGKFVNVTNGVTQRRWLLHANPLLANFISDRIGRKWITHFCEIENLRSFASDPKSQEEFLAIKEKNKRTLLNYLAQENAVRDAKGKIISHSPVLGTDALFDVQIKRFHEYKRQLMNALHLIMVYQELGLNPNARQICRYSIFGGKSAPGYEKAKQIMQLISAVARKCQENSQIKPKLTITFIENYNVSQAEIIIPGADLSEQISAAGWEASGTGNMKLAMNGALTIGTEDGANIEMRESVTDPWWPFRFGASAEENREAYNPWDIYTQDEPIKRAVDTLKDGTFAKTAEESASFGKLYQDLIEHDPYRVLKDLRAYYETQKKVETLFQQPKLWAETAIHNIAGMARFSTDESIRNYAEKIWDITPCPLDPEILAKVQEEYSEHDRCKIHPK
ncbi:MAG: glycogen/starch/alpha-glucan family phosphorylase [Chlamydiota bacterium]